MRGGVERCNEERGWIALFEQGMEMVGSDAGFLAQTLRCSKAFLADLSEAGRYNNPYDRVFERSMGQAQLTNRY